MGHDNLWAGVHDSVLLESAIIAQFGKLVVENFAKYLQKVNSF